MTDPRTLKEGSGSVPTEKFNAIVDVILSGLRVTASNVDSGAAQDGDVLTADGAGGASWEAGGGGSLPDSDDQPVSVLALLPEADSTAQPTIHQIDASHSLIQGWSAETDYSAAFVNTDVVTLLKPTGSANIFAAEINGAFTDSSEPDWDGDAPNVGDSLSDNDVTWYNVGVYATWLATAPVEWEADTEFLAGTLVVPPTGSANGHLYVVFPPGPYTSATEPDPWPTDGTYASGDSGYLYDLGPKLAAQWSREFPVAEFTSLANRTAPAAHVVALDATASAVLGLDNQTFRDANPDFGHDFQMGFVLNDDGSIQINTDTNTALAFDAGLADTGQGNQIQFVADFESKGQSQIHAVPAGRMILWALALILRGMSIPADADLVTNGDWAIAATDTDFVIKKKTSAGAIKTLTIPWDA